jgi:arabinofuranosyltransferase
MSKTFPVETYARPTRIAVYSLAWAAALSVVLVFIKIAWVTEDAYIIFRSVEQLFAGNGPRWNPHERVQAFTSPLWFAYLSVFRMFSSNVVVNAILASAFLFLPTLWLIRRLVGDPLKWLVTMLLLVSSIGFFDYTTSGLENPLAYLLIVSFLLWYHRLFATGSSTEPGRSVVCLLACSGLLVVCRHDLATLIAAPVGFALWRHRASLSKRQWAVGIAAAAGPLLIWSSFALIYYGTPLPNSAYAKLGAGIPQIDLIRRGLGYLGACLRGDTVTVVVMLVGAVWLSVRGPGWRRWIAAGVALNLAYVVAVAGDFMLGRFLSFGFLASVVSTVAAIDTTATRGRTALVSVAMGAVVYMFGFPNTPVSSPLEYRKKHQHHLDVAHERGVYAEGALVQYLRKRHPIFPDHEWARSGFMAREQEERYVERTSIGYFGYWAGCDIIIVDALAMTDPLLARLPIDRRVAWRIGHFTRRIPRGYRESILTDTEEIVNPGINEYYRHLKVITQGRIFTRERFRTIVAMNTGAYNHLLADARRQLMHGDDSRDWEE